jgi:AraC family transcriptional regulator
VSQNWECNLDLAKNIKLARIRFDRFIAMKNYYTQKIQEVQNFIIDNLAHEHSLEELGKIASFSPYHFHRIFAAVTGETVKAYIRRTRMDKAALSLIHSKSSIIDIALATAFESHEAFSRAFKKQFDQSPSDFQKNRTELHMEFKKNHDDFVRQEMEVKVENLELMNVAYLRHTGPYTECGKVWGEIFSTKKVLQTMTQATVSVGICYDDPEVTASDKIRYDACVSVPKDFTAEGTKLGIKEIAGKRYATAIHKGAYTTVGETYKYLFGIWLTGSSERLDDSPCLEIYLNNPSQVEEKDLETKICLPLAQK